MDIITNWLPELITGLLGGGLVALFTIPEKKASARLDNAERVVAKYEDILKKYEKRISELEEEVKTLREDVEKRDTRIHELEQKLLAMETKRNAKGQFVKRTPNPQTQQKVVGSAIVSQDEI